MYLLTVNMQVGGFKSLTQLALSLKQDVLACGREIKYLATANKEGIKSLRKEYESYVSVDGVRGVFFAFCWAGTAMFAFEVIWVFAYDYFQFGNLFWPVYYYGKGNPLLNSYFLRNLLIPVGLGTLGGTFLYFAFDGEIPNLKRRFEVKWRTDGFALAAFLLAICAWTFWIYYPSTFSPISTVMVIAPPGAVFNAQIFNSSSWIFPKEQLFPQTEYTFYPAAAYLQNYAKASLFGFYINDWALHLVNVTTKYLTFLAVCFPAMVRVTR